MLQLSKVTKTIKIVPPRIRRLTQHYVLINMSKHDDSIGWSLSLLEYSALNLVKYLRKQFLRLPPQDS